MKTNEHATDAASREDAPAPCFVRHEDAGGKCARPAALRVYGLDFCAVHGEEARIGAELQERYEASCFFERFNSPHVPPIAGLVGRELEAAAARLAVDASMDEDHWQALGRAYDADVPERTRERVRAWESDVGERGPTVLDHLLEMLATIHKCMRIAHEDRETWLVEKLEVERESVAAQAACALLLDQEREAAQER